MTGLIEVADEVRAALAGGTAVVALETTLVAHGFPHPDGVAVGASAEAAVRAAGAVPATIGVAGGRVRVGLGPDEIARFGEAGSAARKLGARDLAACAVQGALGATTVGGTLAVCRATGIRVMATGGLGGVHRGYPHPPDVSGDLGEIARTRAAVVCSGVKSLLDVPATCELLETLGVPVLGFGVDTLPLFYTAAGGPPVPSRVDAPAEVAAVARAHWELGGAGLVVAQTPPVSLDGVESLIVEALAEAERAGVRGPAVTPFVLGRLHERSGGRTLAANRDLVVANAALAGLVAVALGPEGLGTTG